MYLNARRRRAAPLSLGAYAPAGSGGFPNWSWDVKNWVNHDAEIGPLLILSRSNPIACSAMKRRDYDPNTLCTTIANGQTLTVPCDLAVGPRPPTNGELDRWYQAALADRYGCNSWGVANGEKGFEFFTAPDGQRYSKVYNGDDKVHAGVPPNTLMIKRMAGDLLDIIGDIGNFLLKNACTIGGLVVGGGNPAAGAAAGSICRALVPGQAAPPPGVLVEGSLIQAPPDANVYVIAGGTRHLVPDPTTLQRHFAGALIHQIDAGTMASIPLGQPMPSDGGLVPGISNQTLAIGGAAFLGLLLLVR